MAILKCKMCGGDILLSEDKTFGTCEYCGSTMTFPKVSDEQRLNLFNRANHYRRMNDFDKAIATYERILEQDDSDAEAHFGAVLSRFGIEYVEDPASHERIPTCHRVQAASFLTDEDYLAALEHAPDAASREIYEREGKRIAGIQKDILAISAQEKPYDVFICYKETGEDGQRTKDSTLAQEIYYELTNAGYKVFFSRITLEDKLGTQYEPYIFAALNSAKVMLVIGTKPEHFNAVWVKNEWSRYLALMKTDRKRLLIPCYRDMDAYELPEELSGLQSQDMSRIGFMQDIIRGVKKVLDADKAQSAPAQQTGVASRTVAPGVDSLLKRARLFLENGEWDRADEYAEKVLDIDPESALAYMVKVCAAERVRKEADLAGCKAPISPRTDYQNALRFAAPEQKAVYEGYNQAILERLENERKSAAYEKAKAMQKAASTEGEYLNAAKAYQAVSGFRDAGEKAEECKQQAQIKQREAIQQKKRNKRIAAVLTALAVLVIAGMLLYTNVLKPMSIYKAAEAARAAGKYEEARAGFESLGEYKDATEQILATYYAEGLALKSAKQWESARAAFTSAGTYSDASTQILATYYAEGEALKKAEQWEKAKVAFAKAGSYGNAEDQVTAILDMYYQQGVAQLKAGDYTGALTAFKSAGSYSDAEKQIVDIIILPIVAAKVGDVVTFGSYEQDNNKGNGTEPIEWIVLATDGKTATLISRYALDCQPYNTEYKSVTWETCTLRTWLNGSFLEAAFSSEEQKRLQTVTVSADKNPEYDSNPGKATQDRIYLLSIPEAKKYFSTNSARVCKPTAYAKAQWAWTGSSGTCWWWLRSPGYSGSSAAGVDGGGSLNLNGSDVNRSGYAVRPVVVVGLSE